MNNVTLQLLHAFDLNITYSRKMLDGSRTHYKVGYKDLMLGADPLALVKAQIEKDEGTTEFTVLDLTAPTLENGVNMKPASILEDEPELQAIFACDPVKSTILQQVTRKPLSRNQRASNLLASVVNPVIRVLNRYVVFPLQAKRLGITEDYDTVSMLLMLRDLEDTSIESARQRQLRLFKPILTHFEEETRHVHPASYFAITYYEGEEEQAFGRLLAMLKKAQPYIIGYLAPPTIMSLSDSVGFTTPKAIFAFVFLDRNQVNAALGREPHEVIQHDSWSDDNLLLADVLSVREGSIGPTIGQPPRIEYVYIQAPTLPSLEERAAAVQKSYDESLVLVRKAAQKTAKHVKKYDKLDAAGKQKYLTKVTGREIKLTEDKKPKKSKRKPAKKKKK